MSGVMARRGFLKTMGATVIVAGGIGAFSAAGGAGCVGGTGRWLGIGTSGGDGGRMASRCRSEQATKVNAAANR